MAGFVRRNWKPAQPSKEAPEILNVPMVWKRGGYWELKFGRVVVMITWDGVEGREQWNGSIYVWGNYICRQNGNQPKAKTERAVARMLGNRLAPVVAACLDIQKIGGAFEQ